MDEPQTPRFPVQIPVTYSSNDCSGGGLISHLSTDGCTVESEEPLAQGMTLVLRLHLSEHESPVKVDLAVVRGTSGLESDLEFIRIPVQDQVRLRAFVQSLETESNS